MKLYVGNLSFQTSSQELEDCLRASARSSRPRRRGPRNGPLACFGFVEMASQEDGQRAIAELNGTEVGGREIKVNEAKPREDRGRGAYGGGGGYGGGSNRW